MTVPLKAVFGLLERNLYSTYGLRPFFSLVLQDIHSIFWMRTERLVVDRGEVEVSQESVDMVPHKFQWKHIPMADVPIKNALIA